MFAQTFQCESSEPRCRQPLNRGLRWLPVLLVSLPLGLQVCWPVKEIHSTDIESLLCKGALLRTDNSEVDTNGPGLRPHGECGLIGKTGIELIIA